MTKEKLLDKVKMNQLKNLLKLLIIILIYNDFNL